MEPPGAIGGPRRGRSRRRRVGGPGPRGGRPPAGQPRGLGGTGGRPALLRERPHTPRKSVSYGRRLTGSRHGEQPEAPARPCKYPPYLESESGRLRCKRRGCFVCIFPAWWTRYLDSVSAVRLAQIPLSLLFLELSGYCVNTVQLMSTPQTSWSGAA